MMGHPTFLFSFTSDAFDVYHINDFMRTRGWRFNGQQYPNALHMAVTRPQTQAGVADTFADDLADAVAYANEHAGEAAQVRRDLRRRGRRHDRRGRRVHPRRHGRHAGLAIGDPGPLTPAAVAPHGSCGAMCPDRVDCRLRRCPRRPPGRPRGADRRRSPAIHARCPAGAWATS